MKTNVTPGHAGRKIVRLIFFLFVATLVAPIQNVWAQTNYYVGGTGASDSNSGTSSQPFATIQKAATVAVSGNIVNIRPGTYRETVTPVNSGVTFQPDGGTVVISGLNTADGGWTVHSGSIYKKTITLPVQGYNQIISSNTTIAANQIFKDTTMYIEARWPKAGHVKELLHRSKLRQRNSTSNWTATSLTDASLPNIAGGWIGGKIWITGWFIAQTRDITSHSGTTIGFPSSASDLRFSQYYYVTGKLGALTQAKEWHYEAGTLYLWQDGGGSPTGIQYKARNWGFDLRGKSNTTIIGLELFACEINADVNSSNTIIDGINVKYLNHTFLQNGDLYTNARQTGLKIIGPNSVIRNSEIQYAASQAVWLGQSCRMENNLVTDINYEGNYAAGVNFWNPGMGNQVVTGNTFARHGRSAIDFSENEGVYPVGTQTHHNMDISYNDIYHSLMISSDGGQLYGSVYTDLTGTRIHHNWIHDSKAEKTPSAAYEVGVAAGIYFDQASGPTTSDHNVLWNNYQCDFHTQQNGLPKRHAGKSWLYNNTFLTDAGDNHTGTRTYLTTTTDVFDVMRNNIYRDDVVVNWGEIGNGTWDHDANGVPSAGGDAQTCLFEETNPVFVGTGTGGLAYRIQTTSPAKNAGTVISGITDGSVGVPDMGAYEFGGTDWVAGYVAPAGGMVATPTFSPLAGTYTSAQSVTISTTTSGASIRYTTDGSTPTASSTLYSGTINVSSTTTLKAIGIKSGSTDSNVATAVYTINTSGTTTVNDFVTGTGQNQFEYVGSGWLSGPSTGAYLDDEHYNLTTNSYYNFDFTGTQIQVYSQKYSSQGISAYSIDGGAETLVDAYHPTLVLNTLVYTSPTLTQGTHTLKARVTGTKNASSSSYWLDADRMVITTGETTVATPTFNPVAGTYTSAQSVTISTTTSGAEIRYTTDGSTPTGSSTLYTAPISVSATTTLKAIGIKSGLTSSAVATALYTIQVATPTFNPVAGAYTAAQSVTISTATSGADIRYTTDGSTPTGSSTLYTAPVSVSASMTLKAIGIKTGLANSDVATAVYTIQMEVNDFDLGTGQNQFEYVGTGWGSGPSSGAYQNDEHYSGTTNDYYQVDFTGTQIAVYSQKYSSQGISAYSIDGGAETMVDAYNPTLVLNTLVYTSPTLTQGTHTLKARVTGTKNASSSYYWLDADRVVITSAETTVATPTFSPVDGTYTSNQSVTISTATSGASIRYTTDGSTPTGSSTLYSTPVSVSASTTLKAIGIKAGLANSAVGTAVYTIQVATPTFSPVAGTYTSTQSVTISTATSGSTIRYTTDGSTPTASSTLYSSPVSVSSSMTLKAIGIKSGLANSAVGSAAYTIQTATTTNNTVTGTGQNQFEYVGSGWLSGPSTGAYQNDEHYTATANSYYNVDFTGAKIEVYSQKFNSQGISAYSIDGGPETLVDQYYPTLVLNTLVYSSPALTYGAHTLKVRVTGTKNASSSYYWLVADRVVVLSSASGRMRTGAAIDELQDSEESLVIYPNPGTGRFSLKGGYNIQAIEVYNAMGAKVQTLKNMGHGIQEIDISTLPDGIYFITLFNGEGYISRKVIKAIKN